MTTRQNKEKVRKLWAAFNDNDFDTIAAMYAKNVKYHGPAGERRTGRAAAVGVAMKYRRAFPDLRMTLDEIVADGDLVVVRARGTGTHMGELDGVAPTGRSIDVRWIMNMVRIEDGLVAEEWEIYDNLDLMSQLGLMPSEASTPKAKPKAKAKASRKRAKPTRLTA